MSISELEEYFRSAKLPEGPFYLNPWSKVEDARHFLNSHFGPLKQQGETFVNIPLKHRLMEFKAFLEKENKNTS